jgi:hypothetical protein
MGAKRMPVYHPINLRIKPFFSSRQERITNKNAWVRQIIVIRVPQMFLSPNRPSSGVFRIGTINKLTTNSVPDQDY